MAVQSNSPQDVRELFRDPGSLERLCAVPAECPLMICPSCTAVLSGVRRYSFSTVSRIELTCVMRCSVASSASVSSGTP